MNYIRQVQTISGTFEKHLSNIRLLVPKLRSGKVNHNAIDRYT